MSEQSLPCRAPYVLHNVRQDDATVTLKVGQGVDKQKCDISIDVLRNGSEYFSERLHDENPGTLTFPNESPAHFKVLITFLHTGAIRHPNFRATAAPKHAFLFLTELFAFAGRFDMYALRNAILDAFFIRMTINPDNLPYESIRDVYAHTSENSSLRDLIIDTVIHIGTSEDVEKWSKELPRQFLVDCLKVAGEDEVVLYRAERGVWVEQKGKNMCAHYHVHEDKDEDEEDKDDEEEEEISEQTRQELAFIDELRKAQIRY